MRWSPVTLLVATTAIAALIPPEKAVVDVGGDSNYSPMELCDLGLASGFKTALGISPDYPTDRMLSRVKMALAKITLSQAKLLFAKRQLSATDGSDGDFLTELWRQLSRKATSPAATSSRQRVQLPVAGLQTNWHVADTIVDGFMSSPLIESIAALAVTNISMVPGAVTTVYMDSPMVNLGQAICAGAGASYLLDPYHDTLYTCALGTAVALSTCTRSEGPKTCEGATYWEFRPFPTCSLNPTPTDVDLNIYYAPQGDRVQGAIDFWLFQATSRVAQYTNIAACLGYNSSSAAMELIPGWEVMYELWYVEEGEKSNGKPTPLSLIAAKRSDQCQVLIATRGTATGYEWQKDFEIAMVPLESVEGLGHSGVTSLIRVAHPKIEDYLVKHFNKHDCDDSQISVTVTGHSLGGGISTMLGLYLGLEFSRVNVITFAALHTLDVRATKQLMKSVNTIRNWVSEFDPVPYLPCATSYGLPRCSNGWSAQSAATRVRDIYSVAPNVHYIWRENLKKFSAGVFGENSYGSVEYIVGNGSLNTDTLKFAAPLQITSYHTCSYPCYLDQEFCGSNLVSTPIQEGLEILKCSYC